MTPPWPRDHPNDTPNAPPTATPSAIRSGSTRSPSREPHAPLRGTVDADLAIVGGGFTGLWAAHHALAEEPDRDVVVLEADRCGVRRERAQRRFPQLLAHAWACERALSVRRPRR